MEDPYEQLKKGFRIYLALVADRKIPASVSVDEVKILKELQQPGAVWGAYPAFTVYRVLNRHVSDLRKAGFNFDSIPPVTVRPQARASGGPLASTGGIPLRKARPRTIIYDGDQFEVAFEYNPALNEAIKAIPGKSYNVEKRVWLLPVSAAPVLKALAAQHGFTLSENAGRLIRSLMENVEASYASEYIELNIPLKKKLLPFQTGGVAYALKNQRVIIGDQMGLGKTIQAIATVMGANLFPCLVICPKSLRFNWKDEWGAWTHKKAHLYTTALRDHLGYYHQNGFVDVAITHFEGMKKYLLAGYAKPKNGVAMVTPHKSLALFKSVIIDEAHEFRNTATERFGIARHITRGKPMVLLLTGTPVVNTVADMGALLELSGHIDSFGGLERFKRTYGEITETIFATGGRHNQGIAAFRLRELNTKLRAICFIRREKYQVLKELPDKLRQIIQVDIDNRPEYDLAFHDLQTYLAQFDGKPIHVHGGVQAEMLARIGVLKRISARGKMYAVYELINTILAGGEKVVVFCWHLETVAAIQTRYPAAVAITGNETDEQVEANKKAFQESPFTTIMAVTYKRGGVGHTLTASSKVIMVELGWNHKDQDQAEDRLHRIGAKDTVNAYYFLGRNTIDQYLYEIINSKRNAASMATGGTETIQTEAGVVAQIIKMLGK